MHNVILSEAKDLLEDNMQGHYYVYMMGSASGRALYVGVTNDLQRRVLEHKNGETAGFTSRYRCYALLYYEPYSDVRDAIAREKQIKGNITIYTMDSNLIFGIRPVAEAIEAGKQIEKLYIRKGAEGQLMQELKDLCMRHRLHYQEDTVEKLNRLTRGNHQGVVAQTAAIEYVELADILERVPDDETPLIVLFDGVTDVRNFGAIARSAECAGAHGLITPLKNSAPVNAEAIRSSAGALTTIPVCRVGSVRNTLKALQAEGFQVVAATEKSRKLLYDADFRRPTVIVMGAEDTGISKEVLKLCDEQLAIPLIGHIESLNVSAAAAVMLFEVVRQRIGPEN